MRIRGYVLCTQIDRVYMMRCSFERSITLHSVGHHLERRCVL